MPFPDPDTSTSAWHDAPSNADVVERACNRLAGAMVNDFADLSGSLANSLHDGSTTTGTLGSFDISNDALGHSSYMRDMLPQQTPTITSRMMKEEFADFSMVNVPEGSFNSFELEVGRGRDNDHDVSLTDSLNFSYRRPLSTRAKRAAAGGGGVGGGRKASVSSTHSDPSDLLRPRSKGSGRNGVGISGSPGQKAAAFPDIDFSPHTTPKRGGKTRLSSGGSAGSGAKVTELVSNSGSGGSRSKFNNPLEDVLSDAGSITDRPRASAPRFTGAGANGRKPLAAKNGTNRRPTPPTDDLTGDVPAILGRTKKVDPASDGIPKGFKSTEDFLKELGLAERTSTLTMQQKLQALKDPGPLPRRPPPPPQPTRFEPTATSTADQSFLIPHLPDMTELFSMDATRFSAKMGAAAETHRPIESIPVPQDERAVLMAMRLLQEKVATLEGRKATAEQRCLKLESELKHAEAKVQQEQKRARLVEEELTRRHEADSALGGSEAGGDAEDRQREKLRLELQMEKLKLETSICSLKSRIEDLEGELESARITLDELRAERNAAVNSVAHAITANEDLKLSNKDLIQQIDALKLEKHESERVWKYREERLRQKAREYREAAAAAQEAAKEAAQRDREEKAAAKKAAEAREREKRRRQRESQEREERERAEQAREDARIAEAKRQFEQRVQDEVRRIRPDLVGNRSEPIEVPGSAFAPGKFGRTTAEVGGKRRVLAVPRSRKKRSSDEESTEELSDSIIHRQPRGAQRPPAAADADDTLAISPEMVQRIAVELNQERRKQKAAARTTAPKVVRIAQEPQVEELAAEGRPRQKVVKVVTTYLVDDGADTQDFTAAAQNADGLPDFLKSLHATQQPSQQPPLPPATTQPRPPLPEEPLPPLPSDDEGLEPAPSAPETQHAGGLPFPGRPQSFVDVDEHLDAAHDAAQCTVCVRHKQVQDELQKRASENPLKDIEHAMPTPAPALEPASQHARAQEPDATFRPSQPPRAQLEKVVRQLKDEYRHLKMAYRAKHDTYMALDPAVGKKARKELVYELNELVAEMDTKCDQIYALYDVNEGFVLGQAYAGAENGDDTEALIASLEKQQHC